MRVKYFQAATPARKVLAAPYKHKTIFQSNADQNCWLFRNSALPLYICQTLPARHKDLLLAVPPYYSQRFCTARQTLVRDAASLAKVMAVDGAKHGVRGGKSLSDTGLAMSPIPTLVKGPRFKTSRAHVFDHADGGCPQARWCQPPRAQPLESQPRRFRHGRPNFYFRFLKTCVMFPFPKLLQRAIPATYLNCI